jgi:predicted DNA-binding transcriptional regulator AlpA
MIQQRTGTLKMENLLSDRDLSRVTGRSRSALQKDRLKGDGVPFVKLGRLVRYRLSDVQSWLATRPTFRSTSDIASNTAAGA